MLYSPEYQEMCRRFHDERPKWGSQAGKHAEAVTKFCDYLGTRDVLDYGCGKGGLALSLPFPIKEYDPGIWGKENTPKPADLVTCFDVLEHIEPECLIEVLEDLKRCVKKMGIFLIHLGPAKKILLDGRNAHLIQQPPEWWKAKLEPLFDIQDFEQFNENELQLVVVPKRSCNVKDG